MRHYLITARTPTVCLKFSAIARTSAEAAELTAELLGGQPCGITVIAGVR